MDANLEKNAAAKETPAETESGHHDGAQLVAAGKLRRSLSPRQVQMIAIGGTIG